MEHLSVALQVKAVTGQKFEGHGAVFGNVDRGGDIIVPGAFTNSLKQHADAGTMPLMFWMHQSDQVPGVWEWMGEDEIGLGVRGELLDTALGRDVKTLIGRRAVRGLSIGYYAEKSSYNREGNRILQQVALAEVSIVSMAMNPLAQVEAVKARLSCEGEYVPTERELERLFRGAGCSKSVSRTLISRIFDAPPGGMPGDRWDAGAIDGEDGAAAVLESVLGLMDKVGSAAIRR